jgi:hypothetical protein
MTAEPATTFTPPPEADKRKLNRFYEHVIARADLEAAGAVEGIDEELALLRTRLRGLWLDESVDLPLVLKAMDVLVRVVSAQHRMSKKRLDDFNEAMATVATSFMQQFGSPAEEI